MWSVRPLRWRTGHGANLNNSPRWLAAWALVAAGVLGLPLQAQAQQSITRTSSFEYNAQGQLTLEVIEPDSAQLCLQTTHSYDAQGNRTGSSASACAGASGHTLSSATQPRSSSQTFAAQTVSVDGVSYSTPASVFANSQTNALGHSESREHDPRHGKVTRLVGPNGGVTTWEYDSFGRKTRENRANGTYTLWEYRLCQAPGQPVDALCAQPVSHDGLSHTLQWYVRELSYGSNGVPLVAPKYQFHDMLGRVVRTRDDSFMHRDAALRQPSLQETLYNALGQTVWKSVPFLLGSTRQWVQSIYDQLGRVIEEHSPAPNGQTAVLRTAYDGLVTTTTNALDQTRTVHRNAEGRTVRAVDALGNEVVYTYDALGQLVQTNAAGSITRLSYDLRGRKTSMEDPAMGRWDYAHNAFGELVWQQDSLSQVATMAYDRLGRMTQRNEPDLVSHWYFDQRANGGACGAGIGKLCEATANNGYRRLHTYDSIGRPVSTSNVLDSAVQPAVMSQVYDPVTGRLAEQTWPTGYRAVYDYTTAGTDWTAGHLLRVRGIDGATQNVSWQALDKDAQGRLSAFLYGNNVVTSKDIEAASGVLRSVTGTLNGQAIGHVQSQSYTYDEAGNLLGRGDANTGVTETFQYDSLNRLSLTTTLGPGLQSADAVQMLYDVRGNIRYKSDVGYYHYDSARPDRLTQITLDDDSWAPGALGSVVQANSGTKTLSYAFDDDLAGVRSIQNASGAQTMGNGNLMYTVSQDTAPEGLHTVRWEEYTSFNKIAQMRFGLLTNPANATDAVADRTVQFVYGPEHQRLRQSVTLTSNAPSHMEAGDTWYMNGPDSLGLAYEKHIKPSGLIEHKHYLSAGGVQFAMHTERAGSLDGQPAKAVSYFHHDHLGSLSVITNAQGAVTERLAYDAWGKRRHVDGQRDTLEVLTAQSTQRGYTMHEHMDQMGVINMNGRVYDPLIGRFLSADPHIQHPDDLQSFNRYSYVKNNPLAFTDPSGYFLKKLFKAIVKIVVVVAVVMVLTAVVGAAVGALMGAAANTAVVGSLALGKLVTAGIVNGIVSAASAGSGKAFWGGFISGAAFSFAGGLGDRFGTPGSYAGHAGAGCISAVAGEASVGKEP
ncbi:MAG: RHS repeat-associated core domain-containing protein [Burkholderiaceae bacterium]